MKKIKIHLLYWAHNSVFIYLASQIMPGKFVLGTHRIPFLAAIIISGFLVTLILEIFSTLLGKIKKVKLNVFKRTFVFWAFNFVALWLVARIAPYSGFGVVRFTYLIGLSLALSLIQFAIKK